MRRVLPRALFGLTLLLALSLGRSAAAGERFALLVGSNVGGAGSGLLYFAELDAERFGDVLSEMGGVPEDNLVLLRTPTRRGFDDALERLADRIAAVKVRQGGHATVFFYYSGHAGPDALQLGRQELPFSTLRRELEATGADVRLIFIDSCHAGGANRTKGARRAPGFLDAAALVDARGEVLITSSAADELSQESDEVGGSYFTHYLLSGLRGAADVGDDGEVTLEEAYRYVYHRTVAHTAGTRAGTQHPGFDYDLSGSGDLVVTRMGSKGAALRFDERQAGRFLIFDDDRDRFVAEVQAVPGRPVRLMVDAGRWRVQKREPDALYEQLLDLGSGAEGDVRVERMEAVPYSEDATKGAVYRARRWSSGKEVGIAGRFGMQAFFDEPTRKTLIPPMPLAGVEVDLRGFIHPRLSLRVDLLAGGMLHMPFPDAPARVTEVHGGIGLFYVPRIPGGPAFRPYIGVRLAAMYVHRAFLPPLVQEPQGGLMGAPGAVIGFSIAPDRHFRFGIEARSHLSLYMDEFGDQLVRGAFEGIASVGLAL